MIGGIHRLPAEGLPAELSSPVIDRTRPVRFMLDGMAITAFEGDTVLSALLANGKHAAGVCSNSPLALDPDSAPPVWMAGEEDRPERAMPMALCPATDGARLATARQGTSPSRLGLLGLFAQRNGLGLKYGASDPQPGGWIDAEPARTLSSDIVVVGAGVAGLSAALAAADLGLRVALIDKEPVLGGLSMMFGRAEGEPNPEDMIATLAAAIGRSGRISLYPGTLAFDLSEGSVRAVRVSRIDGQPRSEHLTITGRKVILATGLAGRLPIFSGNRLPGVVDAATAWRLAARYNVWPGRSSHIHTGTNVGYRMALLGAASGKTIARTSDPRVAPQTRFIEFCKAYGYRLGWGTEIASVALQRDGQLRIALSDSQRGVLAPDGLSCDRLIVSAGWQPEIDLWMRAGGAVRWDADGQRLIADGRLETIALAGSVAGYQSLAGCGAHGAAALEAILGEQPGPITDRLIDPIFETPDAPLTIGPPEHGGDAPAYASARRIAQLPGSKAKGLSRLLPRPRTVSDLAPVAHTALDVSGAVLAGLITDTDISRFAAERCIVPAALVASDAAPLTEFDQPEGPLPAYLENRFGKAPEMRRIVPGVARALSPGCMVFIGHSQTSPLAAIGVVMSEPGQDPSIIVRGGTVSEGDTIHVRDGLVTIQARIGGRL